MDFAFALSTAVGRYVREVADQDEHLSLLRWQMGQGHRLDLRETMPGHVVTSAIVLTPDHSEILLIDHITIGRWLPPGGHYEPSPTFHASALREVIEETGISSATLHPWHRGEDLPFSIDTHDVPGKAALAEPKHLHHDLEYLFLADRDEQLTAQLDEVRSARWFPISALVDIHPRAAARLARLSPAE